MSVTNIYGSDNLTQVLQAMATNSEEYRMAYSLVSDAYRTAGMEGIKSLATEHGINYITYADRTTPAWFTFQGIEGATSSSAEILYPSVLETSIDAVSDELVVETAKQVSTKSGLKTFFKGATKAIGKYGNLVGAVATGVDLGWNSYKEHPDFWTDFGDAMFHPMLSEETPVEILARAHSGGYTTAVKEREVARILQGLAKTGAFDYREYDVEVSEPGEQDLFFSEVMPSGQASGLAYQKAKDLMPNCKVLLIQEDYPANEREWELHSVVIYADPDVLPTRGYVNEIQSASTGDIYYSTSVNNTYQVGVSLDTRNGTVSYTTYGRSTRSVVSGRVYVNSTRTRYEVGGMNTDVEIVQADNEVFPNDHSPSNLYLAPTSTLTEILSQLRSKYDSWYEDSFTMDEYNPETGVIDHNTYLPISTPYWDAHNDDRPLNFTPSYARSGEGKTEPDPQTKPQTKELTKNNQKIDDPPFTPSLPIIPPTDTPPDVPLVGSTSSGLWVVYNPIMQELNDLGAYLWTNNIIDLLEKFLQNPMDAIISLHKIFCTPTTNGRKNIMLGYLDSGVSSLVVTEQFKTVDCGTVTVPEYFEDARDYVSPYTTVECYLPFIGIVKLKTQDIIGGKVNIVYTIDVYSGACLAKIFVTKLGAKQLLYNFSGNCSMQIPLTGADRTRLLSGAITGAITGAFMGAEVGAIAGAIGGAWMGGTTIDRTSQFSANAGCMGVKKPYLIVTRKYSYDAGQYNQYYGFPSNITVALGTCKGFTRVKSVHIENMLRATDNEKAEIESLLREGIIIN